MPTSESPVLVEAFFWPPVAFGMFITIHRALNLLTRPDKIPALALVQGAGLSQRGFLAGARTQGELLCLRCYKN
jgi:hypothetical protein